MSDVTIQIRPNGPFLVTGPVTLLDPNGNAYDLQGKEKFSLCRCGESKNKPFCDGTHKTCGFDAMETVPPPPTA